MIHPTFPNETLSTYVRHLTHIKLDQNKVSSIYDKSPIPTKERISKGSRVCTKLRHKILKKYSDVFKDRLNKNDRVKIKPVHLKIDASRNIPAVHAIKPYDIPYHLRTPAKTEFSEMLRSGVLVETEEATDWCSQAFPVPKPNSDPLKCRWVTDFRNLNMALKRPV